MKKFHVFDLYRRDSQLKSDRSCHDCHWFLSLTITSKSVLLPGAIVRISFLEARPVRDFIFNRLPQHHSGYLEFRLVLVT